MNEQINTMFQLPIDTHTNRAKFCYYLLGVYKETTYYSLVTTVKVSFVVIVIVSGFNNNTYPLRLNYVLTTILLFLRMLGDILGLKIIRGSCICMSLYAYTYVIGDT